LLAVADFLRGYPMSLGALCQSTPSQSLLRTESGSE